MYRGSVRLSKDFEPVKDADEEKQMTKNRSESHCFRGLGYVDSRQDVLDLKFDLKCSNVSSESRRKRNAQPADKTIEIELHQDKTALHSRKGDTGSIVWKASIDFAQLVLQQYYSKSSLNLLDYDLFANQHVLELGAGTGLLSIALSPLVKYYTATDIGPLVPLIRKNVTLNLPSQKNVSVQELDWILLESTAIQRRTEIFNPAERPIDLLLAVDCLYHPSLIHPFVSTIDYLATPGQTAVLIFSELRAEDVMREFLESWLGRPGWEIWRVPNDDIGKYYAIWLGWKSPDY